MHTVIITNERSSDLLKKYKYLFEPFVEKGDISFCSWNESGADLGSSVPDLYKLIKGKGVWRVVIVINPLNEELKGGALIFNEKVPFDYNCNTSKELYIKESTVPLIRLTHILSGFPTLGVKEFDKAFAYIDHKTGKEIIVKEKDLLEKEISDLFTKYGQELHITYKESEYSKEEKKAYKILTKKYELVEERPIELIVISTRKRFEDDVRQNVIKSWENNLESESSDFWKRNDYPNNCRFMCFDLTNTENSTFTKELMSFWLAVLTISINKLAASTLQAYKLYNLKVEISTNELSSILNQHISKMIASLENIKELMMQKQSFSFDKDDDLLCPQVVPVLFDKMDGQNLFVDSREIGFTRDCPRDEKAFWKQNMREISYNLDKFLKAPKRVVDIASEYARTKADSFLGEEYELDKYQIEDLNDTIEKLEWNVITTDTRNIIDVKKYKKEMKDADKDVKKQIDIRMKKKVAIISGIIALILYLAGFIPYLINAYNKSNEVFLNSLFLSLISTVLVAVGGFIALLILRIQFISKIKAFNSIMRSISIKVNEGANIIQSYLSNVCTYMKAQSIVKGVTIKKELKMSIWKLLKAHKISLKSMIEHEEELCASYGIPLRIEPMTNCSLFFHPEIPPKMNSIYRFEINTDTKNIPINDTGYYVTSPYKFVSKLNVNREEIYEAVRGEDE